MAAVAHVVSPGVTKEQYDQVRAEVGWLEEASVGGIPHVTWWEGGDCRNADAWDSERRLTPSPRNVSGRA